MPIDFPGSPATNQTYTYGNRMWIWDGGKWLASGVSLTALNSKDTVYVVSYSSTPFFDLTLGLTQQITLTGNVTSSTATNVAAGQTVTFKIVQDGTGGRSFVWPTNVLGGMTIDDTAAAINCQQFHCFDGTNLESISVGSQR